MANSVKRIEFVDSGFKAILQGQEVHDLVEEQATAIKDRANANYGGDGYRSKVVIGRAQRHIGFVYSTDKASLIAESEDKALSRALQ